MSGGGDDRRGPPDVIGIGALNIDHIVDASAMAGAPGAERGTERSVTEDAMRAALDGVDAAPIATSLGGSSFNTIYALSQMGLGLTLGYVGVAGRSPVPGPSIEERLTGAGIDSSRIRWEDRLAGTCISFVEDGERTMLTHTGANARMAEHIDEGFDDLVGYLATAKVVHVTSFLDDETPAKLLLLLSALKRANPLTRISVDPGHVWCEAPSAPVRGILRLADVVLLNHREFRALAGTHGTPASDTDSARILFDRCCAESAALVVKRAVGVSEYRSGPADAVASSFHPQTPLPPEEIVDSTGAGDVFAAGLLAVLCADASRTGPGILLGMRLAKHSMRHIGTRGHADLVEVTRAFLRGRDGPLRAGRG